MADEDGNAHAGRADRQLRKLQDLPRLLADLRLLVELDAVERPVHTQVVLLDGLATEPFHRLRAGARGRLVRGDANSTEPRGVTKRCEHERERDRAAVR